ncbi:TonB-dependent receptor [Flavobacterium humi]|uniref:TonB-dependent receptor n=2 Tax=Flavobacterium humi TaxID=2562683 RepID=A0A4Z0L917_9FLAO|nr:TonB-dependent receptor [Flavobacterium humi]
MKNWFLVTFFFLALSSGFAQGKITGMIFDDKGALPGANVVIEGTSVGTTSDFDGSFTLNTTAANGKVVISFLGFKTAKVEFSVASGKTVDLGTIVLKSDDNVLGEVVVTSTVIDIAKDRKTPVASSTIKATEIREKLGSQEFPEILANTPSVYVTKQGGGFGDSRINIRGFSQANVAVMINGVPVNDMENGAVFWSNWAGLSDVTSAMQVQRGLGSSKLAISSVGGTINVITRTSDIKQGGSISATMGNDDFIKTVASYSTGKMKNGFSASVLLSNTAGDGYVNGTKFQGQNYFIGLGYQFNEKHDLQFTFTGAPQWHNQRSFANHLGTYLKFGQGGEPNIKYNSDWGYLNGEEFSWARNYYHKPVASLNYDFKINDRMKLSSVVYGSWGRGGGTASGGKSPFSYKTASGTVPFNDFVDFNSGTYNSATGQTVAPFITGPQVAPNANGEYVTSRSVGFTRVANVNSHDWYGAVINLNTKLTDKLTLDFGIDARTYTGYHFRVVSDRLGADAYNANLATGTGGSYVANDINNPVQTFYQSYDATPSFNPFSNVKDLEKIEFNNNGLVRWYGAFSQLEYSTEKLSAFIQGAISQQGFKKEDAYTYLLSDPLHETGYENILGGNVKGGANYNINEQHNVFANAGYYSKQPFFNAVYPNRRSIVNGNLVNEKILGFEAGYGFRSAKFNASVNGYYTNWKDRYQRANDAAADNVGGYYDFTGITEIHSGVEVELNAKPLPKLGLNAMVSVGDWKYSGNSKSNRYDINNQSLDGGTSPTLYLNNIKVGDVAQTTASIGANYEVVRNLKVDANYRYSDKLYASISPDKFGTEVNKGTLELPSYGLMDAGISFKINTTKDSKDYFTMRFNVNNVLNEVYMSESRTNQFIATENEFNTGTGDGKGVLINGAIVANTNLKGTGNGQYPTYQDYLNRGTYDGIDVRNQVFFGFGRTWNFTFSYNF